MHILSFVVVVVFVFILNHVSQKVDSVHLDVAFLSKTVFFGVFSFQETCCVTSRKVESVQLR